MPSILERKDPELAKLMKQRLAAQLSVARIEHELRKARQTKREIEKQITAYWRKKGQKG